MKAKVAGIVFIIGSIYYIVAEAISAAFFNASLFNTYVFHAISELGIPDANSKPVREFSKARDAMRDRRVPERA